MTTEKPITPREIELDFLRGIAILAVVDFHDVVPVLAYPFLKLGFPLIGWIGVDVFFVLSGFLVGGLLVKEWILRGEIDGRRFLIRRCFKIWPQYYVFIVLIILTGHHSIPMMWGSFVHLQNYFIGVPHLWTLAVEEHAYLLLVAVLPIAAHCNVRMRTLFWWLAVTCVSVVGSRLLLAWKGQPISYGTHTRIEAILYGVMLAIVYHRRQDLFRQMQSWRWLWVSSILLAFVLLRLPILDRWEISIQFDAANLLGVSLLMLVYQPQPSAKRAWPYRLVAWIGLYSYGIYLWHVSTSSVVSKIGDRLPSGFASVWIVVAQPLAGITFGIIMTKLVEFPMLRLRERWFPRRAASPVETNPLELQQV